VEREHHVSRGANVQTLCEEGSKSELWMKLYHGTSLAAWRDIEAAGAIKPRSETNGSGRKVWHAHPSNPEMIFLTDCYGMYFAGAASHEHDSADEAVLIEVEVDLERLFPDEDFLEAATRNMDGCPVAGASLEGLSVYMHVPKRQ